MTDLATDRVSGGDEPARDAADELDRLIMRRRGDNPANAREALWAASQRRHEAAKRERNRWEWIRFFDRMSANHAALAERYKARAEQLLEEGSAA